MYKKRGTSVKQEFDLKIKTVAFVPWDVINIVATRSLKL